MKSKKESKQHVLAASALVTSRAYCDPRRTKYYQFNIFRSRARLYAYCRAWCQANGRVAPSNNYVGICGGWEFSVRTAEMCMGHISLVQRIALDVEALAHEASHGAIYYLTSEGIRFDQYASDEYQERLAGAVGYLTSELARVSLEARNRGLIK